MLKSKQMDMLHGNLWIKIILFAMPIAFTNVISQLFNSADVAVVGRFAGSNAMAAVGANAPIITLIVNVFFGLSIGANVVIADSIGHMNKEGTSKATHTAIVVAVISGVIIAVIGVIFSRVFLQAISVPDSILEQSVLYSQIYFAGMPFIMLYYFENAIYRSMGDTVTPLVVLIIAGFINVGLNFLFVVGFKMDVAGVAIATVVSNIVSALILFIMLMRRQDEFKVEFKKLRVHGNILKKMIKFGLPAGLQGAVFSVSNVVIQSAVNSLEADAVAAFTASIYFESFSYCFANAFGHAATTFVGQNYGAGNFDRCRKATRITIILGSLTSFAVGALFALMPSMFAGIYTNSIEVIKLAVIRMQIVLFFEWLNTIDDVIVGTLRVYGWTILPTIIYLVTICGVRITWVYAVFPKYHSMASLAWVYPVSWIAVNIIIVIAYFIIIKRMKKKISGNVVPA